MDYTIKDYQEELKWTSNIVFDEPITLIKSSLTDQLTPGIIAGAAVGATKGIAAGTAVIVSGLAIALLATPVGWVIIIGASIAVGIVAAKSGDIAGKWAANEVYNIGDWLNSL